MFEYKYKGFKVAYKIILHSLKKNRYKADAFVTFLSSTKTFHTENDNYKEAEHEIKKLVEHYIDFELKQAYVSQSS